MAKSAAGCCPLKTGRPHTTLKRFYFVKHNNLLFMFGVPKAGGMGRLGGHVGVQDRGLFSPVTASF